MRRPPLARLAALAASSAVLSACAASPRTHQAAFQGRTQEALLLAQEPGRLDACGVRACGHGEYTPLGCAAEGGHAETVKALLAKGAKLDPDCMPPLYHAAYAGRGDMVRLLLDAGANPNGTTSRRYGKPKKGGGYDRGRNVPLNAAVEHPEIVRMLLAAGADPALTMNGRTAAQWARHRGATESAALLDRAADPRERARLAAEKEFETVRERVEAAERQGDVAAKQGRAQQALARYLDAWRAYPKAHDGKAVVLAKLLDLARLMQPPPAIPEAAQEHAARAQAFVKLAESRAGFAKAAAEYEKALESAPWWAEAYYNLGLALEKAGAPRGAASSLKRYLLASPDAPEAAEIKQKIVELEVADELKGGGATSGPAEGAEDDPPAPRKAAKGSKPGKF